MRDRIGSLVVTAAVLVTAVLALPGVAAATPITVTKVSASSTNYAAGAHSDFTLSIDFCGSATDDYMCDQTQYDNLLHQMRTSLPPGLIGNPFARPQCTASAFMAGTCDPASQIGTARVRLGNIDTGASAPVDGKVFNIAPEAGEVGRFGVDVAGVRSISSAVVRADGDFGVDVITDQPSTLKVAQLQLTLWGETNGVAFMSNPTGCTPGSVSVTANSYSDASYSPAVSSPYTANNCGALPFAPSMAVTAGGPGLNARGQIPGMTVDILRPNGGAATNSVRFYMPRRIRPTIAGIASHTCRKAQAPTCAGVAPIGSASVNVPLLNGPLTGPVYLVEVPGKLSVELMAVLGGQISARFSGFALFDGNSGVADAHKRAAIEVSGLPDLPMSRFRLTINSGPGGILAATENLCNRGMNLGAQFTGHNGSSIPYAESPVSVEGCRTGVSVASQTLKISRSNSPAAIKVSCAAGGADCAGAIKLASGKTTAGSASFRSILAGKSATVSVKLTAKARKTLKRKHKLKLKAIAQLDSGASSSATVTIKAKKQKSKKKHRR